MNADEAPGLLDARQRRLAGLLASVGIDPATATFGAAADALAEPETGARLAETVKDAGRAVPFTPALAAALAPYRGTGSEPVLAPRPSVPTYEEFLGKWVHHAVGQARTVEEERERDGGLADDDAVAEQP